MGGSESHYQAPPPTGTPGKKLHGNRRKNILKRSSRKLAHNYEAIMKDAETPVCSKEKMYDHLYSEVFINQRRKLYWVEKNSGHNCFLLFPRDLSVTWGHDKRYWKWPYIQETTSQVLVEVAELLNVCWLEVGGCFDTSNLSPGIMYEVLFVMMMKDDASGWQAPVDICLILPEERRQERRELLQNKPRGMWVETHIGEFETSPDNLGEIKFKMFVGGQWKRGLVIKGVIIRPKN